MNLLLAEIDAYMLRLFGTHADLSDPKRIQIFYAMINGMEYELFCNATAPVPLIIEAVDGMVTDVSHLISQAYAVEWFQDADLEEMYVEACRRLELESRRAG